jgi:hypothetical protein
MNSFDIDAAARLAARTRAVAARPSVNAERGVFNNWNGGYVRAAMPVSLDAGRGAGTSATGFVSCMAVSLAFAAGALINVVF